MIAASPIGPAPTTATTSPGPTRAVEHTDLVAGRQDVGQHQQLLVGDAGGSGIGRRVGERHAHVLGLRAVDLVAEDPPAAAEALPVLRLAAVPAAPHAEMHETSTRSPGLTFFTPAPTATTVPTASWPRIRPSVTAGTSPLRMCRSVPQIVTASTRTIASVSAGSPASAPPPTPWCRVRGKRARGMASPPLSSPAIALPDAVREQGRMARRPDHPALVVGGAWLITVPSGRVTVSCRVRRVEVELPAVVVDPVVVPRAQRHEVVEIGAAAVAPPVDVMRLASVERHLAAGDRAGRVHHPQRPPLRPRRQPPHPPHIQHHPIAHRHRRHHPLAQQPPDRRDRQLHVVLKPHDRVGMPSVVDGVGVDDHDHLADTGVPVLRLGQRHQRQRSEVGLAQHRVGGAGVGDPVVEQLLGLQTAHGSGSGSRSPGRAGR